jgi:adenylate cyclase
MIAGFISIFPALIASRLIVAGFELHAIANPGTLVKFDVTPVKVGSNRHMTGGRLKNRCILVVDDNAIARRTAVEALKNEGYQVIDAESAGCAMEQARLHSVGAFLIHLDMSGRNGIDICRDIRNIEPYKFTPVILFTRNGSHGQIVAAFESGCTDVLDGRSMNSDALRTRLKDHIQRTEYFEQLERTRLTMISYLSRRTLEVVTATSRTGVLPPPEERDLAILFTDLRGFTSMSEEMEPVNLFELVSRLLGHQVKLIHEFGGYVDKFGGDGVMAIFDGPEMVLQSCMCALRIVESSHRVIPEDSQRLWQSGIGIHTGRVVIGNIGTPDHLDYSAIGTTVNLAARLCGQAKATSIVVSKAVRDAAVGDPRVHFHSERQADIRGIREPVTVYTLSERV